MDARTIALQLEGSPAEDVLLTLMNMGGQSHLRPIEDATGLDRRDLGEIAEQFIRVGLIRSERSLAAEMTLTYLGKQVAQHVSQSRASGPGRSDAVRRGILQWLVQNPHAADTGKFVGVEQATAFGSAFTAEEVKVETEYLRSKELITGTPAWGRTVVRPEITAEGRAALSSGMPVDEYVRGGSASYRNEINSTTFGGDNYGGVQTGGSGNVQHIAVFTQDERLLVEERVAPLLQRLAQGDVSGNVAPVRQALEEVRAENASQTATRTTMSEKIGLAMATALASSATTFVATELGDLLRQIAGAG